ncbi:MAG: putative metal-binding motif-containing protein [Myxococcales bacterium]|nr:putative metal-binding motif-containing protein [Myxococcales bacterium]
MRHAVLFAPLLGACSLVVGATAPECTPASDDCAVLNEIDGIAPDACEIWQCSAQSRTCVRGLRDRDGDGLVAAECAAPGMASDCNDDFPNTGDEACNGADDDCDGVIDEAAVPAAPPMLMSLSEGRLTTSATTAAIAVARSDGGSAVFGLVDGATATGPNAMSSLRDETLTSLSSDALVAGCHRLLADGTVQNGTCNFADVGLGLSDDYVFVAHVSSDGCARGQLRLGYFERTDAATPAVIERGPARRSNVFVGVDTDPTLAMLGQCTGASRADVTFGAARPALAVGGSAEALAAWLGDTVERAECGGAEVDVEALALFVERDTMGTPYGWVSASNEGTPERLGRTTGGGRPGVAAWGSDGYVVGFGAPEGGVQLVYVAPPIAPPPYDRVGAPDDRTGRETMPLTFGDLGRFGSGAADDVALAFGSIREGGIELGVTWREGCGTGAESIRFRQVFLTNERTLDEARSFDARVLGATTDAGPPAIAYAFSGLLATGVARPDGRPTGTSANDGGWLVAWQDDEDLDPGPGDDGRVLYARVSEADGAALGEAVAVHPAADHRHEQPALYATDDDQVRIVYQEIGGDADGLRGGSLTCAPGL